jgi:hypothetical protein
MTRKILTLSDVPTLSDLRTLLRDADQAHTEWEAAERSGEDAGPYAPEVSDLYDCTELPTYGGTEPANTIGVLSWDADRVLLMDPWLAIEPRVGAK